MNNPKIHKIIILSEGGRNIGFGHISRCTALYEAFKKEGLNPEFVINGDNSAKDLLRGYNASFFEWPAEKKRLSGIIKDAGIVIIDSYLAEPSIYDMISDKVKVPAYLDDNIRINYPAGTIVNGTIYAEKMRYPKKKGVEYLLGGKYTPLRREFWSVPRKRIRRSLNSIMVTSGGCDSSGMTARILKFLIREYPDLKKNVIIGKGFCRMKAAKLSKMKNVNLIYDPSAKIMRDAMIESDIAISTGGQTLYEMARAGVPAVALCVADNQERNLAGWRKSGFMEYAGWYDDKILFKRLRAAIGKTHDYKSRLAKSNIGRSLLDGKGAGRIARYLIRKVQNENS